MHRNHSPGSSRNTLNPAVENRSQIKIDAYPEKSRPAQRPRVIRGDFYRAGGRGVKRLRFAGERRAARVLARRIMSS